MISQKAVNIFGFVAIGLMAIMLLLMLTKTVPREMNMVLVLIAAALVITRIALRLIVARRTRAELHQKGSEEDGD
jgi:uncharacterized membrane-anchored protein